MIISLFSLVIYVLQHIERNIKVILIFGKLLQMYEIEFSQFFCISRVKSL